MNITVNSQLLMQELRLLNKIVSDKPTIPVLANVLIRAGEALSLQTTDHQLALTTTCPATVEVPGAVTLPAKTLLEIMERLPNTDVRLTLDKSVVHVTCGMFKSRLQALPAGDFPAIPVVEGESTSLSMATLNLLTARVRYAISQKAQKFVLDGALLSLEGVGMALVATDGKRLSLSTAFRVAGPDSSCILPSTTLDALVSLATDGEALFSQSARHLFFAVGSRLLVSRTLEGKFPNYLRIIPQANDKSATVNRGELAAALRRVGVVSEEDQMVALSVAEGILGISAASAAVGQAEEHLEISYEGSPLRVCASGQYVLDFLQASQSESVVFSFKDEKSAMLLSDGADFINVIMPMRVS